MPTPEPTTARVSVGPDWAAYTGPALGLDPHRGAVVCLGIGVDDVLAVETGDGADVVARTVLVPPGLRHRIAAGAGRVAFLFLEPRGTTHHGCADRMSPGPPGSAVTAGHAAEAELVACAARGDAEAVRRHAAGGDPGPVSDPRIVRALAVLHGPAGADVPTVELARPARVSPEHFLRLFARQTGAGLPGYRRWARMRTVAGTVTAGGDLTRAAADAGFATPSHLSLAFHRMFGLAPSRLFTPGTEVRVLPGPAVVQPRATRTRTAAAAASTRQ